MIALTPACWSSLGWKQRGKAEQDRGCQAGARRVPFPSTSADLVLHDLEQPLGQHQLQPRCKLAPMVMGRSVNRPYEETAP